MTLSAQEAADAVGLTKQAIIKSITRGRMSATRTSSGAYRIDPAELFRVYDPVDPGLSPVATPSPDEVVLLRAEVYSLRRQLEDKDRQLDDLRRWLDTALAALPQPRQLTDTQAQPWWQRLFAPK